MLVAGCSSGSDDSASGGAAAGSGEAATVIDWVDFIQFNGVSYLRLPEQASSSLDAGDLGDPFTEVLFTLSGVVTDPGYRPNDGDAAFLEVGTIVYRLSDYAISFRLAVRQDGGVRVYEADTNAAATRGRDLLDIAGNVRSIEIRGGADSQTTLALIDSPDQVSRLVELVLESPVEESTVSNTRSYLVAFQLIDGSEVVRRHWPDSGELQRGMFLPREFTEAAEQAIASR